MSVTFKKFVQFVEIEGEPTEEQINEIFGIFRNNQKLDKLRAEREKLKKLSPEKKAALDKALQDFKDGKKPGQKGAEDEKDDGNPLERGSKTMRSQQARGRAAENDWVRDLVGESKQHGRNQAEMGRGQSMHDVPMHARLKAYKMRDRKALTDDQVWAFIEGQDVVTIEDFERKDGYVYFKPHFDDRFSNRTHEKLEAQWLHFEG